MGLCLSAASPVLSIEDPWYQPSSPSSVLAASFSNDPLHPHQHIKPTSHASFHTTTADAERERSHADSDTETDTDTDTDSTATSTHTRTERAGGKRIKKNMRKRAAPRTESKSHSKPGTSGTTNCTHVQVKANISYDNESSSFERDVICQLSRVWSESTLMQVQLLFAHTHVLMAVCRFVRGQSLLSVHRNRKRAKSRSKGAWCAVLIFVLVMLEVPVVKL